MAPGPDIAPQITFGWPTFAAEDPGDWQPVLDLAVAFDEAGADRLTVSDHVCYGEHLEEYGKAETGGMPGGKQPTGPDGHWLEPLTCLSVAAGITKRIRLHTNILQAALRRPVVLAKTLSTLDVLSRGRVDLGVGVGWQREEYEAAGLQYDGRGKLLDHSLEVITTLWREQRASFDSPMLAFDAIHQMPKPRQEGGVPIWVSGRINKNVARRIARFGSGWIPWGDEAANLPESLPAMKAAVAEAGGDAGRLQVCATLMAVKDESGRFDVDATLAPVPSLVAVGATDFRPRVPLPAGREAATEAVGEVVAAFRKLTA